MLLNWILLNEPYPIELFVKYPVIVIFYKYNEEFPVCVKDPFILNPHIDIDDDAEFIIMLKFNKQTPLISVLTQLIDKFNALIIKSVAFV